MPTSNQSLLQEAIERLSAEAEEIQFGSVGIQVVFNAGSAVRYTLTIATSNQPQH